MSPKQAVGIILSLIQFTRLLKVHCEYNCVYIFVSLLLRSAGIAFHPEPGSQQQVQRFIFD